MSLNRLFRILILALLIISSGIDAQIPHLRKISLVKGNEDYKVQAIFQDQTGYIWFGTDHGLYKYDGINFQRFTISDSLAVNHISCIAQDSAGTMWLGHPNGQITTYDGDSFKQFEPEGGLGVVGITDIVFDGSQNIWYSTMGEGIYRYDGRYLSNISKDEGLTDNYVYDIEPGHEQGLWLATDYGISCFRNDSVFSISMKDGLPDNIVHVLKSDSLGRIWGGSYDSGIFVYDPENDTIHLFEEWEHGVIKDLAFNLYNELWIATEQNGIVKYRVNDVDNIISVHHIEVSDGLISDRLNTVMGDKEGNVWIGGSQGVVKALPPLFEFMNEDPEIPFEMAYSIYIDVDGNFWVCNEKGLYRGISGIKGITEWINISERNGISNANFISVYGCGERCVWTGTYGSGVYKLSLDGAILDHFHTGNGMPDNNVIGISGSDQYIWFSTLGGGVAYYDKKSESLKNIVDEELNHSYIYAAVEDHTGKTWVAGSFDFPAYIADDQLHFIKSDTLDFSQFYGVAVSSEGDVWLNTNNNGLVRVIGDSLLHFGEEKGISYSEIQSISFDKWNQLLIISNEGITLYDPEEGVIREYDENMGLTNMHPILNAVYTDQHQQIWIGTETGIIRYNPHYNELLDDKPEIFLSTLNLNGNPIKPGRNTFRYNENNFTFGYTGLWYQNPEGLTYRYQLKNHDLDWTYSKRTQPFSYSKLPAGDYIFTAQVSLDGKTWVETTDSVFGFTVRLPFWKKWWFILSVVILLVLLVYLYIRQRLSNLRKAKEELEREVHRRTEEIRDQNEELEKQKEEIEAQRDMAEEQRDQIDHQNKEIQASIRYALRIQTAALPPKNYLAETLGDHFILNKPRDIVSGDFYWASVKDGFLFFAVADCTGHGVPGAFMSMLGLSALNDIVKSLDICKASEVLDLLNERIRESLHQAGHTNVSSKDGMDISLCIYEPAKSRLQFSGALNSLYLIRDGELQIVKADKLGIGSDNFSDKKFNNNNISIEKGDVLYLFSDGFPDQFGGPDGKKYKYRPFREYLLKIHKEEMEVQRRLLNKEIENWMVNTPQIDDIMVMGVRF